MRRVRKWTRPALWTAAAIGLGVSLGGCAGGPEVVRIANGRVVEGRFISVDAYAAFLRGALAEQDGDARKALASYEEAASADPADPEVWSRIARTRCRLDRTDVGADAAVQTALHLDARYEPALLAQAFCASLRGQAAAAATGYARAATWEPLSLDPEVAVARLAAASTTATHDDGTRRVLALTLLHRDRAEAWEALEAWGTGHGDVALAVSGMVNVARLVPSRRYELGLSAVALAGAGRRAAAQQVAAALLDAPGDRTAGGSSRPAASLPLVARLAVDEAIARRDRPAIWARAARAHLAAEVVAGRAWAMGDAKLARELVEPTVRADPGNLAAHLLRDALSGRASAGALDAPLAAGVTATSLPPEVALPLAQALTASDGVEGARRVLAWGGGVKVLGGDALLTSLAVDLAITGAYPEQSLPTDARLELLARRLTRPVDADLEDGSLDARHRLFGLSLTRPTDPATLELAQRLASAADRDPLVASALATLALARGATIPASLQASLDTFAATDPIVASRVKQIATRGTSTLPVR